MTYPRLALLRFRDVLVTPYTELLDVPFGGSQHRGGPRWPDWSTQTAARHCRHGVPIDDEPREMEPTSVREDLTAWGGAIPFHSGRGHYGHQIAEFSTRLLPTLAEIPDVRFAFAVMEEDAHEADSVEKMPVFFREILDWYGISEERVEIIAEPTLVERLVVAPQAEQLGAGPEPWYLDMLDTHTASRLGQVEQRGSLYVSRATQWARFAGEGYLENVLEDAGFHVFYPETVTVEEKLRTFASAESIIIAEGSGLHTPQLMGRGLGDVTVLVRHPGWRIAQEALAPRARSLRYLDVARGAVYGKDFDKWGGQGLRVALYIFDPEGLEAGLPAGSAWDRKAFDAAVEADVVAWLQRERASRRWQVPGSPEQVSEKLREFGFSHVAV